MEPLIRDISDTARWVAVYRARESERPGCGVPRPVRARPRWGARRADCGRPAVRRGECVGVDGADLPLRSVRVTAGGRRRRSGPEPGRGPRCASLSHGPASVAALDRGRSARRSSTTRSRCSRAQSPVCPVERVRLDLFNVDARRGLFARLGREARRIVVVTEGLLIYLMADAVRELARDLAAISWHPALDRRHRVTRPPADASGADGRHRQTAGAPYLFAPPEGPAFFESSGWKPVAVGSMLKTARKLDRLPLFLRMMAMLPNERTRLAAVVGRVPARADVVQAFRPVKNSTGGHSSAGLPAQRRRAALKGAHREFSPGSPACESLAATHAGLACTAGQP